MHATATIALRHQSDNAQPVRAGSFRWLPSRPGRSADRREATQPPCVDDGRHGGGRFIAAAGMQGAELRIDVQHEPEGIDTELDQLYRRLNSPDDALSGTPAIATGLPDIVFRCREADGEYYVYAEDIGRRRLAGYTVFNRLVELNRRIERQMRSPHSKYAPDYQRHGIASAVYACALDAGFCLISGARQSAGAHALWRALARRHALGYVAMHDKSLRYLGPHVDGTLRDDLSTRMILFGRGWDATRLTALAGNVRGKDRAAPENAARIAG